VNNDGRNDWCSKRRSGVTGSGQLDNGALSAMPDTISVPPAVSPSVGTFAVGDANADGKDDIVAVSSGGGRDSSGSSCKTRPPGWIPPSGANCSRHRRIPSNWPTERDGRNDVVGVCHYVLDVLSGPDHTFDASEYNSSCFRPSSAGDAGTRQSLATGDVTGTVYGLLWSPGAWKGFTSAGHPSGLRGDEPSILGKGVSGEPRCRG